MDKVTYGDSGEYVVVMRLLAHEEAGEDPLEKLVILSIVEDTRNVLGVDGVDMGQSDLVHLGALSALATSLAN